MAEATTRSIGELLNDTLDKVCHQNSNWVSLIEKNFGAEDLRLLGVEILSKCMSFPSLTENGLDE